MNLNPVPQVASTSLVQNHHHPDEFLANVAVIIPALNEEEALPLVLQDLPAVGTILVVDNGSTDRSASVAAAYGARVVQETRRGYGSACLRGLQEISRLTDTNQIHKPQIIVFLDADYSDSPDHLPRLIEPILKGHADFVLGSRLLGQRERGSMPPQSVYGNHLACLLMKLLLGHKYTDLGPFRAIRTSALYELGMVDTNFGWTVEMQIKAVRAGLKIQEIPVPYRCRVGTSKISGTLLGTLRASEKILRTIARYAFRP